MIVDASALVAILLDEPECAAFVAAIDAAETVSMSAGAALELDIVIGRFRDVDMQRRARAYLDRMAITVEAFTAEQARVAGDAHTAFGRWSGHPARLTFGDCMTYALARVTGEPLLFKGDDFGHTDLVPAIR